MEFSAQQVAGFLSGIIEGDPNVKANSFSKIEEGEPGVLIFLANPKHTYHIYNAEASIVLASNDFKPEQPIRATLVKVENAYVAFVMLLNLAEQSKGKKKGVDSIAFIVVSAIVSDDCYVGDFTHIGESVRIGKGCVVYPHIYIGDHATVGDSCAFYPHVTVHENYIIGNNCTLHTGSVIGTDGLGFVPGDETYRRIPQLGNAITEDDIKIGANTTISRTAMGSTIIYRGVKLDNLVQTAHSVEVGGNTVMAVQVGVAGSIKVGKHCMFGGQVGSAGHIHAANHVVPEVQAGVISDVRETTTLLRAPVVDAKNFMRSSAIFDRLLDIYRSLEQM